MPFLLTTYTAAFDEQCSIRLAGVLDDTVVALVYAMNRMDGIRTCESCGGHGKELFRIWFKAESLDALRPLFEILSSREGWNVVANRR